MPTNNLNPEIIIYGGAFDPPHQGHLDCVRSAAQRFPNAKILIVPARNPAGAAGQHKTPDHSYDQRLELCKIAFAKFVDNTGEMPVHFEVASLEAELPCPNYTFTTLKLVANLHPNKRLGLLIGQDQLQSFHKWHEPRGILQMASLVVVKRDYSDKGFGGILKDSIAQFAEHLGEPYEWIEIGKQANLLLLNSAVFVIDNPICIAASSIVRDFIAKGKQLPAGWMPESVLEYINRQQLYGVKGSTP